MRHSRREIHLLVKWCIRGGTFSIWSNEAFWEENFWFRQKISKNFKNFRKFFFEILKFYIFLVIPRSWGVHRYPWFENWSIDKARAEADKHRNKHTMCFIILDTNSALLSRFDGRQSVQIAWSQKVITLKFNQTVTPTNMTDCMYLNDSLLVDVLCSAPHWVHEVDKEQYPPMTRYLR